MWMLDVVMGEAVKLQRHYKGIKEYLQSKCKVYNIQVIRTVVSPISRKSALIVSRAAKALIWSHRLLSVQC